MISITTTATKVNPLSFFLDGFGSKNVVLVHTEKPNYYPGERVAGTVSLSLLKLSTHIQAVYVKVTGTENVIIPYTETIYVPNPSNPQERIAKTLYKVATEEHQFLKRTFCLYSQGMTVVGAGNFVFPFEFTLDTGIPGSFHLKAAGGVEGSVVYRVSCEVVTSGLIFDDSLRHAQEFCVKEPMRALPNRTETTKESDVTFLCCINKGRVGMSATVDKNAAFPGERINLHLVVNNSQSQVDLRRLGFNVNRQVTFRAKGQTWRDSSEIISNQSPEVLRGTMADRHIDVVLPGTCLPTTHASLITCGYELEVELVVPWSPNVRIRQPLTVYAPAPAEYVAVVTYPQGWQATTLSAVSLDSHAVQSPLQPPQAPPAQPQYPQQPPSPQPFYAPQPQPPQQQYSPQQPVYSSPQPAPYPSPQPTYSPQQPQQQYSPQQPPQYQQPYGPAPQQYSPQPQQQQYSPQAQYPQQQQPSPAYPPQQPYSPQPVQQHAPPPSPYQQPQSYSPQPELPRAEAPAVPESASSGTPTPPPSPVITQPAAKPST
jgi:hypothetical protein